jgi:RNA polymerase sigma-70 factor (ECF subfamily)
MNPLGMQTPANSPNSRLGDTELVTRVLNGDPLAFETIMRRHNRLLFRTAYGVLRNHAETEDALQEAYVRAWRSLHTFRGSAKLSTWLARIVLNESLGRARRHRPQVISLDIALDSTEAHAQEWLEDDPNTRPEHVAMRSEVRQLVRRKIDSLPQAFRTVFVLRGIEELSVAEAALALDVPRATVRTRYFRARGLLRESLSHEPHFGMENVFSFDGCAAQKCAPGRQPRKAAAGCC